MAGTSATPLYVAGRPPEDPRQLPRYLAQEFEKMQRALQQLAAGHVDVSFAPPAKPREGDFRLSDGVYWDPVGAGAPRFVGYRDGAWALLG
jgi:hypothetical protein